MDIATVSGLFLVIVAIIGSISGGDITAFIDIPSTLVVGLGVIGGIRLCLCENLVAVIMKTIFTPADPKETIDEISNLAETAKENQFHLRKS